MNPGKPCHDSSRLRVCGRRGSRGLQQPARSAAVTARTPSTRPSISLLFWLPLFSFLKARLFSIFFLTFSFALQSLIQTAPRWRDHERPSLRGSAGHSLSLPQPQRSLVVVEAQHRANQKSGEHRVWLKWPLRIVFRALTPEF